MGNRKPWKLFDYWDKFSFLSQISYGLSKDVKSSQKDKYGVAMVSNT